MDTQDGVVGLDNGGGDLGAAPDGERDLGLLAVIDGKALEQEAAKTGTGTTADGVVDEETLETSAIVGELANAIQNEVDDFFADGVVTAGEVVSGILLSGDQLLRVEQLTVGASADLIDHRRLQVDEDAARNVLAGASLGEERVERIITATDPMLLLIQVII